MSKQKRIISGLISCFLFTIIFLEIFLIRSFRWLNTVFGDISFATVVYQLMSPMKGTSSDIFWNYALSCVVLSLVIVAVIFAVYKVATFLLEKRNAVFARFYRVLYVGSIVLLCIFLLRKEVIRAGVPEYLKEVANVSFLFEEEYVNPTDVRILFPEHKRNLILIYLESMESTYSEVEDSNGKKINYIPELTQLAMENICFSNSEGVGGAGAYGNTGWTMAGLLSSSMGVPYGLGIDGNESGEYKDFLPGIRGLGEILQDEGYKNYFMCGSDAVFGGRYDFFSQHGNYEIYDYNTMIADGLIAPDYFEFWGIEDRKLYEFAQMKLTDIAAAPEPFNFTLLTVDTHHPQGYVCELCHDDYSEQYGNVISCASRQVYDFVRWVQEQEWYNDTVIVLTGDHLSMNVDFFENIESTDRKVYNCIINALQPKAKERIYNRNFSTMDMFPTILASMGVTIEGERLGLGTNLFSDKETLAERIVDFDAELKKYSSFYTQNFIVSDETSLPWFIKLIDKKYGYSYVKTWYPYNQEIWGEGFGESEGHDIWMIGDESIIEIPLEKELVSQDLEIDMDFVVNGSQQRIEISVEGKIVFADNLQKEETEISFTVPGNVTDGNTVCLHVSHFDAISPKELGHGPDERRLSLCVYKLRVKSK